MIKIKYQLYSTKLTRYVNDFLTTAERLLHLPPIKTEKKHFNFIITLFELILAFFL